MAKTSSVEKNKRRERLSKLHAAKRAALKAAVMNRELPIEDRFEATLKLAQLPAMVPRIACGCAANLLGGRAAITANSSFAVTRFVIWPIRVRFRAS